MIQLNTRAPPSQFVDIESKGSASAARVSPLPNAAGRSLKLFVKVGIFAAVTCDKMAEMAKNHGEDRARREIAKGRGSRGAFRIGPPEGSRPRACPPQA